METGGESGIRTHVTLSSKHAFQACAFSHSAISPARKRRIDSSRMRAAAQTASMAASQMAQQQAVSQLAGFNGQIKSKDDVTVQYQLVATGQTSPLVANTLQGKAK